MIKTYRGKLADGGQDKINLKTLKGEVGYKINKFQTIGTTPGATGLESIVKIYKLKQSTIDGAVDFTDEDLLAVSSYARHEDVLASGETELVIFDKEIFNQDIYITGFDSVGSAATNYYLELEQVKLNENESTMATLQSLRRLGLPRN